MARPLDEQKRKAILTAAAELVATLGTGASTGKIANAAGVAEGTLFVYFATKDDLLNQLLVEIEADLAQSLPTPDAAGDTPRERVRRVWDCLVDWGLAHPVQRRAMRQLKVSDRISAESRQHAHALFRETRKMIELSLTGHSDPNLATFHIDTVLMGLAEIAMEAIAASPKDREYLKQAGFNLFWKGTAA